jgi:hypothetical protein
MDIDVNFSLFVVILVTVEVHMQYSHFSRLLRVFVDARTWIYVKICFSSYLPGTLSVFGI